ncbi:MAG: 16S rRNA (cytosine967-C5)-methyltransferase [Lentimonas sp.]|jgi:16S rRNA (cytosine967-C5)-methyltransferase
MRRIKFNLSTLNLKTWEIAVKTTEAYLTKNVKANQLLDSLPKDFSSRERATCQALFLGALRNGHRVDSVLQPFIQRKPRRLIEAIIFVTGYEILSSPVEKIPKIIHYAVEGSKQLIREPETRLLNALLRKLPDALNTVHPDNRPDIYFSHPKWLFKRWNKTFGLPTTLKLMEWNQKIPATYLKFYDVPEVLPEGLEPTQWSDFYKVSATASWQQNVHPLLNKGNAYVKDPSTRLAPTLLAPANGEQVLDLCAAPGGKTYDLAHLMQLEGHIVALDLPGDRTERLRENLEVLENQSLRCSILEANLLELNEDYFIEKQLPSRYDAVMLDAPCSNTGVIQRRTDVKWRLNPKDVTRCADLQRQLIAAASCYVKPGGRLVYSTCSIDPDENQAVVDAFLESKHGSRFALKESVISLPWETGHDGAGAFLLVANE